LVNTFQSPNTASGTACCIPGGSAELFGSPKTLARDTGYLFVTFPQGGAQGEIAVMLGFKPKPAAAQAKPGAAAAPSGLVLDPGVLVLRHEAVAGAADREVGVARGGGGAGLCLRGGRFRPKDENAWIQNQADEPRIVTEMSRTQTATVRTTSQRGKPTQDGHVRS
jgi:hypothetical protein